MTSLFKNPLLVTISIFAGFSFACSQRGDGERLSDPNEPNDIQDARTWTPECDPRNVELLQVDKNNCGTCGNACTRDTSDQCIEGQCRCGFGPPCSPGADCIAGRCIEADNTTICQTNSDCQRGQECILDIGGGAHCIDVCEFDDVCPPGHYCVEGACTFVECVQEECNGLDDDCDGTVDEASAGSPLARFCYSGPDTDYRSILPPCQAGVQVCLPEGQWSECMGEIPPTQELGINACDLVDNDCDGCIDGVLEDGLCVSREPTAFDVVFVIDTSGSMFLTIVAVQNAVNITSSAWASNPQFKFAIVLVPGAINGNVELYHNLSDFSSFQTALMDMEFGTGGDEPQWDAVYELCTGELPISWRENSARIIIVFTDENGQSTREARGKGPNLTEEEMCSSLTHGEVLATVTMGRHSGDFDDCGLIFTLQSNAEAMAEQLDTIIVNPCR